MKRDGLVQVEWKESESDGKPNRKYYRITEIGKRAMGALEKAEIINVGQVLELLSDGDEKLLAIDGFGRKSLADLKRRLKSRGFSLPEPEAMTTVA